MTAFRSSAGVRESAGSVTVHVISPSQISTFHPNGTGPHFSSGTIGMGPIVRALMNGDRDDVLLGIFFPIMAFATTTYWYMHLRDEPSAEKPREPT